MAQAQVKKPPFFMRQRLLYQGRKYDVAIPQVRLFVTFTLLAFVGDGALYLFTYPMLSPLIIFRIVLGTMFWTNILLLASRSKLDSDGCLPWEKVVFFLIPLIFIWAVASNGEDFSFFTLVGITAASMIVARYIFPRSYLPYLRHYYPGDFTERAPTGKKKGGLLKMASKDKSEIVKMTRWQKLKKAFEQSPEQIFADGKVKYPLVGQDTAINALRLAVLEHDDNERTPLSMLFSGASGVGKTQLGRNFGAVSGFPFRKFDMGNFKGENNGEDIVINKLIGMPNGYQDSDKGGLLTGAIAENPEIILLFDEMEKAASGVYDLLLGALDRGFIEDGQGRKVDCSGAIFLFTTNVGRDIDPDLPEDKIRDKMVRAGFRPEFMGRIGRLIPFRPLSAEVARKIGEQAMDREIGKVFKKQDKRPSVKFRPFERAMDALLADSGYKTYGVRVIDKQMRQMAVRIRDEIGKADTAVIYPLRFGEPELKGNEIGIGVGRKADINLNELRDKVASVVKGQDHALNAVISQLEMRQMGLVAKPNQPEGTFLFTGPSGTGKTEMVEQIAKHLDREFLFFNMGNFENESKSQAFFGAPPGYIGSDQGGQLTQAVLDHPNAVILLDEIEKADPKIWDGFLSVFDKGMAKDSSTGEEVPFSQTMIFMTSNLVAEDVGEEGVRERLRDSGYFRTEMVNRIEHIVGFKPLSDDVKAEIVRKVVAGIVDNYNTYNGTDMKVDEAMVQDLARDADFTNGARDVQRLAQQRLAQTIKKGGGTMTAGV
ncbi:MAG TPA: AAA family ATPase [Mariprofundaceae bacterium]|nr:AAA family ATPase [Mariprofundaceae bacterium]